MPTTKMKFAFIEDKTKRKALYKLKQKELFKKAHELSTLCGVEMAIVIYSSYHNQPDFFPNYATAFNTFERFSELSVLDQSKHMMTGVEFMKQGNEKLEKQIHKVRKENRVKECTNKMHEVLKGNDIPNEGEGSTLNARQPMVPDGTSSEEPRAPLLETTGAPVSTIPSVAQSTLPGVTNFKGPSAHLLVPVVDPISEDPISMVTYADPSMVPSSEPAQSLCHLVVPLRTPQTVAPVDPSRFPFPLSPSFSLEMFPPMVVQMCPPLSQEMAFRRAPRMAPPMPPTTMASPIPSPIMTHPMSCSEPSMVSSAASDQMPKPMCHLAAPLSTPQTVSLVDPSRFPPPLCPSFSLKMFPPVFLQTYPPLPQEMAFRRPPRMAPPVPPTTMASPIPSPIMTPPIPVNNNQNYSVRSSRSPVLSEMLDENDDVIMTLMDDPSFNNINVQDPNHHNNL